VEEEGAAEEGAEMGLEWERERGRGY